MKKTTLTLCVILQSMQLTFAQPKQSAVIANVYTYGINCSSIAGKTQYIKDCQQKMESLLRIELLKTNYFNVIEKRDIAETIGENQTSKSDCFSKECQQKLGNLVNADKAISCSIENLGDRMATTIKILNVKSGEYDIISISEFINAESEIQTMLKIALHKVLNIEYDKSMYNNLLYYSKPIQSATVSIENSGPRMGVAILGGDLRTIISSPENKGGYDVFPILSQFGYQFETAYLNAGNFHALAEFLILFTGIEQNLFNPSISLINGFRSSKSGFEFGFGPTIRLKKTAEGYYDDQKNWNLKNEWVTERDSFGVVTNPNPYEITERMDSRGTIELASSWVWAIGKTFHSGYLNIPLNAYLSHSKDGWYTGVSVGFNVARNE